MQNIHFGRKIHSQNGKIVKTIIYAPVDQSKQKHEKKTHFQSIEMCANASKDWSKNFEKIFLT